MKFFVALLSLGLSVPACAAELTAPEPFHYKSFSTPGAFQHFLWDYADAHDQDITGYDPALKRLEETVLKSAKICHPKPDDAEACTNPVVPDSFRASLATIPLPKLFMMYALLEGMCRGSGPDEPRHAPGCEFGDPVEIALAARGWCSSSVTGQEGNWVACQDE